MNLDFFSALSGFIGTILIFFFGIPPKVDRNGHSNLVCEQENEKEKEKYKKYKRISYFGVLLIAISFLIQLLLSLIAIY
jgi:uncharacterized membrane protein